jgi:2-iminobutanoate/2-iminopropanoate deaminase
MFEHVSPNPETDAKLAYSQGLIVPGAAQTLYISGQIGVDATGVMAADFESQARQAWKNLIGVLSAADMRACDLLKLTVFLTDASDYPIYASLRKQFLGDHKPASTLLVVASLALPSWKVEIEGIAARAI